MIRCDMCGVTFTDKGSLDMWVKGMPCPILPCPGTLVKEQEEDIDVREMDCE